MPEPDIARPPTRLRDWSYTPIPPPDGVDANSVEDLVRALKDEGFLREDAPVNLAGVPERLQAAFLSGALIGARKYGTPMLVDPLTDIGADSRPDGIDTAEHHAATARLSLNLDDPMFKRAEFVLWSERHWVDAENLCLGIGLHEIVHKAQTANGPEQWKFIEDKVGNAVGDWKAPYTNSFRSSGLAFDWSIHTYGKRNHFERDAMALEMFEHGYRDEFVVAVHEAYVELYGPTVTLPTASVARARERVPAKPTFSSLIVGPYQKGKSSTQRGERFVVGDDGESGFYFRCDDRRFMLNRGLLVDVDRSIASGELVATRFENRGRGLEIEHGLPLMHVYEDIPEDFVPGRVTEAVMLAGTVGNPLWSVPNIPETDLVTGVERDLAALRARTATLLPPESGWPMRERSDFSLAWTIDDGASAANAFLLSPNAKLRLRMTDGRDVEILGSNRVGFVPAHPGQSVAGNYVWATDLLATLQSIEVGKPLRVRAGESEQEFGTVESVALLEQSVLSYDDMAKAMANAPILSRRAERSSLDFRL